MADRVSTLPDEILCHILSFLPTTDSVTTTILSKRWNHLWRFVHTLNFSDDDLAYSETDFRFRVLRFSVFVYSALFFRDATQLIKSFSFTSTQDLFDDSSLNHWISFVLLFGVERLHLRVPMVSKLHDLPLRILTSNTLVVLKLEAFNVEGFSSVSLPSLRILHLHSIWFPKASCFMEILAGCPVLMDLQVRFTEIYSMSDDDVFEVFEDFESLSLAKLIRADFYNNNINFPLTTLSNVGFLGIEIDKFYWQEIPTFCNLTHMDLIFDDYDWDLIIEVLKNCPKLQVLDLSETERDIGSDWGKDDQENWKDPKFVPECLLSHLRICSLHKFVGLQLELQLARYILRNGNVLQSMIIWCSGEVKMIKEKLSSCRRSSAACQLSIH